MDISKLDYNFIEIFAWHYSSVCDVYKNIDEKSPRELKKIRKWVEKTYLNGADYPEKVMKYVSKDVSDTEFFEFFKACKTHIEKESTKQKQLFEKNAVGLSEEVKFAFMKLFDDYNGYCYNDFNIRGDDAYINYTNSCACCGRLVFKNATGVPTTENNYYICINGLNSLLKDDDGYRLVGLLENWEDDTEIPFVIHFTDAQVETEVYKADYAFGYDRPWSYLVDTEDEILCKGTDIYNYQFNDKEKELLPLLKEIKTFNLVYCQSDDAVSKFPIFTALLKDYGYAELLAKVEKLEQSFEDVDKRIKLVKQLSALLNKQKYEPLWREIYNKIVDSQTEYPLKSDMYFDTEKVSEIHEKIQKTMESCGYTGQYPDFVKQGEMKKIHLTKSYDKTYFVGREKNVQYHIKCLDIGCDDSYDINFVCGTAILRDGENTEDIFDCLFDANGKRLSKNVLYESVRFDEDRNIVSGNLEQAVQVAVKKAELQKLTKEERKIYGADMSISIGLLLFAMWLFMGVFFGTFVTLGMMIIGAIFTAILLGPQEIPSMIMEIPWWKLWVAGFVGFGVWMGLTELQALRDK